MKLPLAQAVCIALALAAGGQEPIPPAQPAADGVALKLTPTSLDFGAHPVGVSGPPKIATLSNPGTVKVTIRQIIASGIDFDQTNDCGASLVAGAACTIEVTFKPAITGPRTGNLNVVVSDGPRPLMIALNGAGG